VLSNEADRIRDTLRRAGNRKGDAARLLGMSRSKLWRKMREFRIPWLARANRALLALFPETPLAVGPGLP